MSPRRVRFSETAAPAEPQMVPSLGPVVFTVPLRTRGIEEVVDLSDLGHPKVVRPLAAALAVECLKDTSVRQMQTARLLIKLVRDFVRFAATVLAECGEMDLDDLEPELIDSFEDRLAAGSQERTQTARWRMFALTRMLRRVDEEYPDRFGRELRERISYGPSNERPRHIRPLDAYPFAVFEAMEVAAQAEVARIRDRILEGERLAALGDDPDRHGWDRLENICWHLANKGPLTVEQRTQAVIRMGGMHRLNAHLFLNAADMVRFQVLLGCQTGMEPEAIKQLKADCLVSPARGFVSVAYLKRRSHGDPYKSLRIRDGGNLRSPGGVIRLARRLTQRARDLHGSDALWMITLGSTGVVTPAFATRVAVDTRYRRDFLAAHSIDVMQDRNGGPVSLDLRRLRKTYKSRQYLRAGGILPDFTSGHTPQVAGRHYADIPAHDEIHDQAVESGLTEALAVALAPPVVVDDDGRRLDDGEEELLPEVVKDTLSGATDVWLSSCKDFFASPWAVKAGAPCPVPPWVCLECPNAVFTTRHLPAVLSVLDMLERQREEFSLVEWQARFGLAHERITNGVLNRFSAAQIATARAIDEADGPRLALSASFLETLR